MIRSPSRGSGKPTTATSRTAGCSASTSSTSSGETLTPPRTILSSRRPRIRMYPSASSVASSPVTNQPSGRKREAPLPPVSARQLGATDEQLPVLDAHAPFLQAAAVGGELLHQGRVRRTGRDPAAFRGAVVRSHIGLGRLARARSSSEVGTEAPPQRKTRRVAKARGPRRSASSSRRGETVSGRRRTCSRDDRSAPRRPRHPTRASAPSRTEPATRARRRTRSRPHDPPAPPRGSRRRCRCRIARQNHPRSEPGSPRCGRHPWAARSFPSYRRSRQRRRAVEQDRTRPPRGPVARGCGVGDPVTTLPARERRRDRLGRGG